MKPEPQAPARLHPYTREVLEELSRYPHAAGIIIGGGVALQHYHLEVLEARRPLDSIAQAAAREAAQDVRGWVRTSLCRGA